MLVAQLEEIIVDQQAEIAQLIARLARHENGPAPRPGIGSAADLLITSGDLQPVTRRTGAGGFSRAHGSRDLEARKLHFFAFCWTTLLEDTHA
jgi:hypothetical protein